eukprot:g9347.t1
MTQSDRALLQDALRRVFQGDGRSSATLAQAEVLTEAWMQDRLTSWFPQRGSEADVSLSDAELLELACGLREAQLELGSFPMDFVMEDLNIRLRRKKDEVELSHFLLLRMCRVMDLWHLGGKNRQRRDAYRIGSGSRKDLPLRLTAAFLDRSELGEVVATPEQWATMLCSLRHLDEPFFERITPRLLQQLLPHLQGLSDGTLLRVLDALAKAPPKESPESSSVNSPLEQAPAAFNAAIAEVVSSGKWDLRKVISAFSCVGRLGWYDEHTEPSLPPVQVVVRIRPSLDSEEVEVPLLRGEGGTVRLSAEENCEERSGKTYTMEGYRYRVHADGPQVCIDETTPESLGEKIYDLLNPAPLPQGVGPQEDAGLRLRWDSLRECFFVENLFVYQCATADDALRYYNAGVHRRRVGTAQSGAENSPPESSVSNAFGFARSHVPGDDQGVLKEVTSNLTLVDLAGSEKAAASEAAERFKERSLESEWAALEAQENLSTLQYASQAALIQNEPVINLDPKDRLIEQLQQQLLAAHEYILQHMGLEELPEELRANSVRPVKVHKMSSGKASGFSLDRADFAWQRWRGLRLVREG